MHRHHNFEVTEDNSPPSGNKCLSCLRSNALTMATAAGVLVGAAVGFILRASKDNWTQREAMYIGFLGEIFLSMLKALVIPLIVSCLISAVTNLDLSLSKRVAARAVAYYLTTTFASVVLGIIVVTTIRPGVGAKVSSTQTASVAERNITTTDTLLDLVRQSFPPNIIEATMIQHRTNLTPRFKGDKDIALFKIGSETTHNTNIIGLIVASTAIGIALVQLGEETGTLKNFFDNLLVMMMKITSWVINLSPVGVMFLVAAKIIEMEDLGTVMSGLGLYFVTVMVGLGIQGFIILPILYFALTRRNPFTYIKCLGEAIVTAFGTASSTATLPITIRCLEEKLGIDPRIARFTLPIGAVINMDGTALYEAVAAIFIAQVRDVPLDVGRIIAISITATAASIGAAGIPQAGLVTMVMVLDTLRLPAQDISLILAVDWLLDRFRTAINVMGDAFGSGVVHYRSQNDIQTVEEEIIRRKSVIAEELRRKSAAVDNITEKEESVALIDENRV